MDFPLEHTIAAMIVPPPPRDTKYIECSIMSYPVSGISSPLVRKVLKKTKFKPFNFRLFYKNIAGETMLDNSPAV